RRGGRPARRRSSRSPAGAPPGSGARAGGTSLRDSEGRPRFLPHVRGRSVLDTIPAGPPAGSGACGRHSHPIEIGAAAAAGETMSDTRIEKDSLGEVEVPAAAYYGAQTERARRNFPISGLRLPRRFIAALGSIKREAAAVNE